MSVLDLFTPLGTVLSLTSATLQNGTYTNGNVVGGSLDGMSALATVTFAGGGSATITLRILVDGVPVTFQVQDSTGSTTTAAYVFDPANGTSQTAKIFCDSMAGCESWKMQAKSNGAPTAGDAISVTAKGR